MGIQESGEMYLESILVLSKMKDNVRSIDISDYMGYSKPSVCRAVKNLKNGGYITVDKNGYITLTDAGLTLSKNIYEKHTCLTDFLISIGVDEENANADACKIEHIISDKTFDAIKDFINKKRT